MVVKSSSFAGLHLQRRIKAKTLPKDRIRSSLAVIGLKADLSTTSSHLQLCIVNRAFPAKILFSLTT